MYPGLTRFATVRNALGRFLIASCLKLSGNKNIKQGLKEFGVIEMFKAHISPTVTLIKYAVFHTVHLFCVILKINTTHFPRQHCLAGTYNGHGLCSLCGRT
jgi:hypothetical protein